jgi:hypothetical protein
MFAGEWSKLRATSNSGNRTVSGQPRTQFAFLLIGFEHE